MDIEEKKEELKEEYNAFMRDGKPSKAHHAWKELRKLRASESSSPKEKEPEKIEPEEKVENEFEEIKGVGPELAVELKEEFDSIEKLKASKVKDLIPIPGIGEKKAEKLLKRVGGE